MQEVVDVPGLVADHQVVVLRLDHVGEHHEVVDQDLVHPPDRLERVQVVLAALALDVRRLVEQRRRRRVDPLAVRRPAPWSPDAGPASRSATRAAARAARRRSPRRGGRARARSARRGTAPAAAARRAPRWRAAREPGWPGRCGARTRSANVRQVGITRLTSTGSRAGQPVPAALDREQRPAGELGQPLADRERPDPVVGAVAARATGQRTCAQAASTGADGSVHPQPTGRRVGEHRRVGVADQPSRSSICLVECGSEHICSKKNRRKSVIVRLPASSACCTSPSPGRPASRPSKTCRVALGVGDREPQAGAIATMPGTRRGARRRACTAQVAAQDSATSTARSVPVASSTATMSAAYSAVGVGGGTARPAGAAAAPAVEGDHPEVPGQVADLRLPEPRVDDLPGRQQHHRRAVLGAATTSYARSGCRTTSIGQPDAVPFGDPGAVGQDGPALRSDPSPDCPLHSTRVRPVRSTVGSPAPC